MFGDTGHGTIMLLFALFLILREKQLAAKSADDEVNSSYLQGNNKKSTKKKPHLILLKFLS
jgi:vacuolar-type H+-ATPase subunit I/STV1